MNNIGLPELSILGIIALAFFGLRSRSKKSTKVAAKKSKMELDPMASFANNNSDYDNTPIGAPPKDS